MEDDTLKDHCKTTSISTDMEELGSDNADQELTLTLLGSDDGILDQVEAAIHRIEDGSYGRCEGCGEQISKTRLPSLMPQSVYDVRHNRKKATKPSRHNANRALARKETIPWPRGSW